MTTLTDLRDQIAGEAAVIDNVWNARHVRSRAARKAAALTAEAAQMVELGARHERAIRAGEVRGAEKDNLHLAQAGWERKSGLVHAPVADGTLHPMWPDWALFGELDEMDAPTRKAAQHVRLITRPWYKGAFERWFQVAVKHGEEAAASMLGRSGELALLMEAKSLSESVDTAGGFAVPPDFSAQILARLAQQSIFWPRASVVPTIRDQLVFPSVQANATASLASVYSDSWVGGWVGETPTTSDTDSAYGQVAVPVKKLLATTRVARDLAMDSLVSGFLDADGAANFAAQQDGAFLTGDGRFTPLGILNSGVAQVDVAQGTGTFAIGNASGAGSSDKILSLFESLPGQYQDRAVFIAHNTTLGEVVRLQDAQHRYLFERTRRAEGEPWMVRGYPVGWNQLMPVDGTQGNQVLVLGDLSTYVIAARNDISLRVLSERFADADEVGIRLFCRVGGSLKHTDGVRVGYVNS